MKPTSLLYTFAALFAVANGHKEPKTEKEIEVQRALQAAAYHVRIHFYYALNYPV